MADRALVYVADVMCSWCWGFKPALDALQEATGLPVELIQGGLRPGDAAEAIGPEMQEFLKGCWTQVYAASGQPFDHAGLNKPDGWRYDTELPAMAVGTMRAMARGHELAFFDRLQRAFYAENIDVTDPTTWPALLGDSGVDPEEFVAAATADLARQQAWQEFTIARRWGITGFPALLVRDGTELALVTKGWAPTEPLVNAVTGWLAERTSAEIEGDACAIDGPPC